MVHRAPPPLVLRRHPVPAFPLTPAVLAIVLGAGVSSGFAQTRSQEAQFEALTRHHRQQLNRSIEQMTQQYGQQQRMDQGPSPSSPFQIKRAGPNGPITLSVPGSQPITFEIPNESAPLIDPSKLEAQLPEQVGELPRVRSGQEDPPAAGFRRSTAKAEYMSPRRPGMAEISLSDAGGMMQMIQPLINEALAQDIDEESEAGFTRTTMFNGFKGTVTFDKAQDLGRITLLANRVFVEVTGRGVPVPVLEKAVEQLDGPKLASLQP